MAILMELSITDVSGSSKTEMQPSLSESPRPGGYV